MRSCVLSHWVIPNSMIPWTVALWAFLSMGFPRQEYWNWLPFPSPEDLPDPGIEPRSPALQAESLPLIMSSLAVGPLCPSIQDESRLQTAFRKGYNLGQCRALYSQQPAFLTTERMGPGSERVYLTWASEHPPLCESGVCLSIHHCSNWASLVTQG